MTEINFFEAGIRIRRQRELLGMTREQLAERVCVSAKFCSDIELGAKGFSVGTLVRLSDALKLSADYILLGDRELTDTSGIVRAIGRCPADKLPYLEEIVKSFLASC